MKTPYQSPLGEDELTKLLRLKRYEQPPSGFHEEFLREFQRRQRLQPMNVGLVGRMVDTVSSFLDHFRVPAVAYGVAGIMAVAAGTWILSSDEIGVSEGRSGGIASAQEAPAALQLNLSPTPTEVLPLPVNIPSERLVGTLPPRYLLQNRPAAHSDPFRF